MRLSIVPRPLGRLASLAGLLAALAGCSAPAALNMLEPKAGVTVTRDLPYAADPRQRLDVYAPSRPAAGRPVVVFFYGGSWDSGSKADYGWVGDALARQGYVAVLPDYRVYPRARWPIFLQDSALAVRWARDHAGTYGGDASRLVLMGHSAGAYNAVDLAVDDRWLSAAGVDAHTQIRAVVGLSGPYDFLPLESDELKAIFGPEPGRPDTQPINHVDGRAPPMLLATGDKDSTVDPGNTDRMAGRIRRRGGQVQAVHYPGLDHVRMVAALATPLRWMAPVMKDVSAYIDAQTGFRPD
jgi:acetyl esterase/lipase